MLSRLCKSSCKRTIPVSNKWAPCSSSSPPSAPVRPPAAPTPTCFCLGETLQPGAARHTLYIGRRHTARAHLNLAVHYCAAFDCMPHYATCCPTPHPPGSPTAPYHVLFAHWYGRVRGSRVRGPLGAAPRAQSRTNKVTNRANRRTVLLTSSATCRTPHATRRMLHAAGREPLMAALFV